MTSVVNSLKRLTTRPASGLVVLLCLGISLLAGLISGCDDKAPTVEPLRLQGTTFGTGWSLVYLPQQDTPSTTEVRVALEAAFDVVNASMNTYDPTSTISRFNALPAGEPMEVDWDFTYVFNEARKISEQSGGGYDVTISPLLKIWGFGPDGPEAFPSQAAIDEALSRVGLHLFDWDSQTRTLSKKVDGVSLEFSSIAKGYGVDLGADALDELGIANYMLEVGGEMQVRGLSPRGDAWRVAIERPENGRRGVQAAISVTDIGVATSGDYRNYFEHNGQRYSHLVDPRTGFPIEHDLVSATVIHPSTALADAWATALCIMGAEEALALAEQINLAIFVVRREGDELVESWSPAFAPYLDPVATGKTSG